MSKTISPYLMQHRRDVWIARLRQLLSETLVADHDAHVQIRAQTSVFDLIEAGGEEMIDALTVRGSFRREEVTLIRKE